MTPLTIIPNYEKKRLKCYGTVAAGEHVLVTVTGGTDWVAPDGENQTLRLRLLFGPHTVGVFPFVTEEMHEDDPETFPTVDAWGTDGDDPTCDLNLNTIQAAKFLKFGGNCLFVLDDPMNDILYATGEFEVLPWPKRRGADLPYDLDGYPDFVFTARKSMEDAAANAQSAAENAATAVETVNAALDTANNFVNRAETAATNAQASANGASNSKQDAEAWAVGERGGAAVGTDDETYHNNAKYYAGQAGDAKTDAAASATSAATSATAAAGSATSAAGSATSAAASAQSAAGAAEAAVETEKERAEGAESDLADAIDAEKERAEGAEALAIVNAEYNGTSQRIVFTTGGGDTITIDASAFIKDGMISSVAVSNGNLVITFNSDAGKQPISIPLTQIFNPSNYYDKDAADGTFVKKDGAKVLSTEDYTTAEKTKLSGIAPNANAYVLPPATSSALGGVKQGTGCTIAPDGTLNVTGGGETPIAPSTDPSAQGKPADAKATGILIVSGLEFDPEDQEYVVGQIVLYEGKFYRCVNSHSGPWNSGDFRETSIGGELNYLALSKYTKPAPGIPASDLAESVQTALAAIPGKADAADLRYRIAEAELKAKLPDGVTVWVDGVQDTEYTIIPWAGGFVLLNGDGVQRTTWKSDGTWESELSAEFRDGDTVMYQPPNLDFSCLIFDRASTLITPADGTSSIDIELPAAVTVDGTRRIRDFILDVDNIANASDLALEFTKLGDEYVFITDEDDDIAQMTTIENGKRVRLYFTECALLPIVPVDYTFHVARVTLGDFVTSTTAQGGNS